MVEPFKPHNKLTFQVSIWLLMIALVLIPCFSYWLIHQQNQLIDQDRKRHYQELTTEYASILTSAYPFSDQKNLNVYLLSLLSFQGVAAVKAELEKDITWERTHLDTSEDGWHFEALIYKSVNSKAVLGKLQIVTEKRPNSDLMPLKVNTIFVLIAFWLVNLLCLVFFLNRKIIARLSSIAKQLNYAKDEKFYESNDPFHQVLNKNNKNEIDILIQSITRVWQMNRVYFRFKKRQDLAFDEQVKNLEQLTASQYGQIERYRQDKEHAEYHLQTVIDALPYRVFWKDLNGAYLGANALFLSDINCTLSQVIGFRDDQFAWQKRAKLIMADDRTIMDSGKGQHDFKEKVLFADNSRLWVIKSKMPLRDPEGKIIGVIGYYYPYSEENSVRP
ncbi:PAS domain-containing protein [Marinomonas sp.]|uniref:PAS domain-containing protein n=1 Tax=Marinomonas sp. TaxID=1904862 RepID=UPI003BA89DF2